MAAKKIDLKWLVSVIGLVMAVETAGILTSKAMPLSPLVLLAGMRTCEILAISWLFLRHRDDTLPLAEVKTFFLTGITRGAFWSLGIAVMAGIAFSILFAMGKNPLLMIRQPLPDGPLKTIGFFLTGAVLSPVAEELFFRGALYTYFRRWGGLIAVLVTTMLFTLAHKPLPSIPVPQLLGGIVFALAYEMEKNLLVPITIHISGNLALFSLSLL